MALVNPDPIFKGAAPSGIRKAFRVMLETHWSKGGYHRLLLPCAGSFGMVEGAIKAGVPAEAIQASDITLYTSLLGYVCDPTKKALDLGFKIESAELEQILDGQPYENDEDVAAVILMSIHLTQLEGKAEWRRWQRDSVILEKERILQQYRDAMTTLKASLGGINYQIRDAHEHIEEYIEDPLTWVWYNPPCYKGGYTKMFDPKGNYTWAAPKIPELVFEKIGPWADWLVKQPITAMMQAEKTYPIESFHRGEWTRVYAETDAKLHREFFICVNHPELSDLKMVARPKIKPLPTKIPPIYDDHEITEKSKLEMMPCNAEMAMYFYDLFVRELGMTAGECFYLFMIDGQVAGTVGFHLGSHHVGRKPEVYEIFGLTVPSERYARINRLFRRFVTTQQFADQIQAEHSPPSMMLPKITKFKTSCLSKHPTTMQNRGILKLIGKEKKDGRWLLKYEGDFVDWSTQQVLQQWIAKHAHHTRTGKEVPSE